ncbi:hypothetical protein PCA31118_00075 [Pandoraea captiosa]|uniref:MFS transporter n=1 Tax=Pandoraea captiosa TaxID=2508302 RepID=A0A5E4ZG45_9BURK|nr:MFS transporter [Pandoraea captiosa]VVE59966.1 hypothetical protein PCA31118_00075 [Pandoraea captiosa]
MSRDRWTLAAISLLSFFLVGTGIVLPSWIAFQLGGSKLVGLVLLSSSLAGLLFAPLAGHIVDRTDRRLTGIRGQTVRAVGFLLVGSSQHLPTDAGAVVLMFGSAVGAVGFTLHNGAFSGRLQSIIPVNERVSFFMRLSVARQIGIAIGTGIAGVSIDWVGSAVSAFALAAIALACAGLEWLVRGGADRTVSAKSGVAAGIGEAARYLAANPASLIASITVGVSFAVIKTTNLLLPGFVVDTLRGDSALFGTLEMVAAIVGTVAVATASLRAIAKRIERRPLALLACAGLSLVVFSFSRTGLAALVLYSISGAAWSLARSAANGRLLEVVDPHLIGRVQAITTVLTGLFGIVIFLLPQWLTLGTEATLYWICGAAVVGASLLLAAWSGYRGT